MKRWPRRGLVVAAVAVAASAALWIGGALRWRQCAAALQRALQAATREPVPATYDERELAALPEVVQRWFRGALRPGQPLVAALRLRQHGTMQSGDDGGAWLPFTASQQVAARGPAFVWDATVTMGGVVPVRVLDSYVDGAGRTEAALLGLFQVADVGGSAAAAEAQLVRFLAEAPWYPTALLPSQGVSWTAIDASRAAATLRDGDASATVEFTFAADGSIVAVHAAARGRTVDGALVPTPWGGRFAGHAERDGMRVPLDAEVFWRLADGERPYWRGHVDAIDYVWARGSQ